MALMSTTLAAAAAALHTWAQGVTPRPGSAEVVGSFTDAYEKMADAPTHWRLFLWWDGEEQTTEGVAAARVAIGLSIAQGLTLQDGKSLTEGRGTMPPILDIVEGVTAAASGLYTGDTPPMRRGDCYLMRFQGWDWVTYEQGATHYTLQLNFTLPRELPPPLPLHVALT